MYTAGCTELPAYSFTHPPLLLLNERSTTADLRSFLKFYNMPIPQPNMLLALLSVLLTDVDH